MFIYILCFCKFENSPSKGIFLEGDGQNKIGLSKYHIHKLEIWENKGPGTSTSTMVTVTVFLISCPLIPYSQQNLIKKAI